MTTRREMVRATLGGLLGGLFAQTVPARELPKQAVKAQPKAKQDGMWLTFKDGSQFWVPVWQ